MCELIGSRKASLIRQFAQLVPIKKKFKNGPTLKTFSLCLRLDDLKIFPKKTGTRMSTVFLKNKKDYYP